MDRYEDAGSTLRIFSMVFTVVWMGFGLGFRDPSARYTSLNWHPDWTTTDFFSY